MMARKWKGLRKLAEEAGELVVELMKLDAFPTGNHPGRKRNVKLSVEDEIADVLAAAEYFIDRHKLDRTRIEKRKYVKYRKFVGWYGQIKKPSVKPVKKTSKKSPKAKKSSNNA